MGVNGLAGSVPLRGIRENAGTLLAAARDADLLVVGARGGGGFARLLMGSVSSQLTHHAECPVVVIRGQSHG
ncbi:MAG: universal stress protein [Trebonia sp.]